MATANPFSTPQSMVPTNPSDPLSQQLNVMNDAFKKNPAVAQKMAEIPAETIETLVAKRVVNEFAKQKRQLQEETFIGRTGNPNRTVNDDLKMKGVQLSQDLTNLELDRATAAGDFGRQQEMQKQNALSKLGRPAGGGIGAILNNPNAAPASTRGGVPRGGLPALAANNMRNMPPGGIAPPMARGARGGLVTFQEAGLVEGEESQDWSMLEEHVKALEIDEAKLRNASPEVQELYIGAINAAIERKRKTGRAGLSQSDFSLALRGGLHMPITGTSRTEVRDRKAYEKALETGGGHLRGADIERDWDDKTKAARKRIDALDINADTLSKFLARNDPVGIPEGNGKPDLVEVLKGTGPPRPLDQRILSEVTDAVGSDQDVSGETTTVVPAGTTTEVVPATKVTDAVGSGQDVSGETTAGPTAGPTTKVVPTIPVRYSPPPVVVGDSKINTVDAEVLEQYLAGDLTADPYANLDLSSSQGYTKWIEIRRKKQAREAQKERERIETSFEDKGGIFSDELIARLAAFGGAESFARGATRSAAAGQSIKDAKRDELNKLLAGVHKGSRESERDMTAALAKGVELEYRGQELGQEDRRIDAQIDQFIARMKQEDRHFFTELGAKADEFDRTLQAGVESSNVKAQIERMAAVVDRAYKEAMVKVRHISELNTASRLAISLAMQQEQFLSTAGTLLTMGGIQGDELATRVQGLVDTFLTQSKQVTDEATSIISTTEIYDFPTEAPVGKDLKVPERTFDIDANAQTLTDDVLGQNRGTGGSTFLKRGGIASL